MSTQRWILSSGSSCIAAREPWPGMVATYHGPSVDRCLYAKTFKTQAEADKWAIDNKVSSAFRSETLNPIDRDHGGD